MMFTPFAETCTARVDGSLAADKALRQVLNLYRIIGATGHAEHLALAYHVALAVGERS